MPSEHLRRRAVQHPLPNPAHQQHDQHRQHKGGREHRGIAQRAGFGNCHGVSNFAAQRHEHGLRRNGPRHLGQKTGGDRKQPLDDRHFGNDDRREDVDQNLHDRVVMRRVRNALPREESEEDLTQAVQHRHERRVPDAPVNAQQIRREIVSCKRGRQNANRMQHFLGKHGHSGHLRKGRRYGQYTEQPRTKQANVPTC